MSVRKLLTTIHQGDVAKPLNQVIEVGRDGEHGKLITPAALPTIQHLIAAFIVGDAISQLSRFLN